MVTPVSTSETSYTLPLRPPIATQNASDARGLLNATASTRIRRAESLLATQQAESLLAAKRAQLLLTTQLNLEISSKLAEIQTITEEYALDDESTLLIGNWKEAFQGCIIENSDNKVVLGLFLGKLQEALVDPILKCPLDEKAVLGSDGITYSWQALKNYRKNMQEPYKNRAPSNPENEETFTATNHPLVQMLIPWIKKHDRLINSEEVDLFAQSLQNTSSSHAGSSVTIESDSEEEEYKESNHPNRKESARSILQNLAREIQSDSTEEHKENNLAFDDILDAVRETCNEHEASVNQDLERFSSQVNDTSTQHQTTVADLNQRLKTIEREIEAGAALQNTLQTLQDRLDESITRTERTQLQTRAKINALETKIKEQEARSLSSALSSGLKIAAFLAIACATGGTFTSAAGEPLLGTTFYF